MAKVGDYFHWNQDGDIAIVVLSQELRSLDWQDFGELTDDIVGRLRENGVRDIVVDLSNTKVIGSETIGFLVRLRGVAVKRGGRMALCGGSELEMETLEAMHLGQKFWHVCSKRCNPWPSQCAECPEFVASCLCDE